MDFLKEYRPKLLVYGGIMSLVAWFLFMLYFRLFEIRPFGAESRWSMLGTLAVYLPLAFLLLRAVYFFGSSDSPLRGSDYDLAFQISRWLYVAFKNFIFVLLVIVTIIGAPRMRYYQMRVVEGSGFNNMSYYEQRSIVNIFRGVSRSDSYDSIPNEDVDSQAVLIIPSTSTGSTSNSDTDSSSSSSKSKSDGLGEIFLVILAIIAIFASLAYYLILIWLSVAHVNFWLVAFACVAVGMITLGIIDVEDGPRI